MKLGIDLVTTTERGDEKSCHEIAIESNEGLITRCISLHVEGSRKIDHVVVELSQISGYFT